MQGENNYKYTSWPTVNCLRIKKWSIPGLGISPALDLVEMQ